MHLTTIAFFAPGPTELIIIGAIVLLLFGSRLPGAMRSLGRSVVEFKKGVKGIDEKEPDGSVDASSTEKKQSET